MDGYTHSGGGMDGWDRGSDAGAAGFASTTMSAFGSVAGGAGMHMMGADMEAMSTGTMGLTLDATEMQLARRGSTSRRHSGSLVAAPSMRDLASATLRESRGRELAAAAKEQAARDAASLRARCVVEVVRLEKYLSGNLPGPIVPPWPRPVLSTRQRSDSQLEVLELQRQLKNPNVEAADRAEMLYKLGMQFVAQRKWKKALPALKQAAQRTRSKKLERKAREAIFNGLLRSGKSTPAVAEALESHMLAWVDATPDHHVTDAMLRVEQLLKWPTFMERFREDVLTELANHRQDAPLAVFRQLAELHVQHKKYDDAMECVKQYVLVAPDLLVTRTGVGGIDGDMLAGDSSLMTGSAMLDGDSKVLGGGGSSVLASPPPLGKQHLTRHNDSGFLSPLPPPPKGPNASTSTFSDAGKPLTAPAQPSSRRRAANRKHGKGRTRSLGPKQRRPGSGSSRGSARGKQSGARGGRGGARSGARGSKRGNHRGQAAASPTPQPPSPMRHESVGDGTSSGGGGGSVGGGESSLLSMPTTVTDTLADQSSLNMRSHLSAGTVTPGVGARPSMFGGPSVAMLDSVMELRGEGSLLASGPAGDGESVWTYVTEEGSSIVSDAPVRRHAGFQPLSTCKTAPSFSITSRVKPPRPGHWDNPGPGAYHTDAPSRSAAALGATGTSSLGRQASSRFKSAPAVRFQGRSVGGSMYYRNVVETPFTPGPGDHQLPSTMGKQVRSDYKNSGGARLLSRTFGENAYDQRLMAAAKIPGPGDYNSADRYNPRRIRKRRAEAKRKAQQGASGASEEPAAQSLRHVQSQRAGLGGLPSTANKPPPESLLAATSSAVLMGVDPSSVASVLATGLPIAVPRKGAQNSGSGDASGAGDAAGSGDHKDSGSPKAEGTDSAHRVPSFSDAADGGGGVYAPGGLDAPGAGIHAGHDPSAGGGGDTSMYRGGEGAEFEVELVDEAGNPLPASLVSSLLGLPDEVPPPDANAGGGDGEGDGAGDDGATADDGHGEALHASVVRWSDEMGQPSEGGSEADGKADGGATHPSMLHDDGTGEPVPPEVLAKQAELDRPRSVASSRQRRRRREARDRHMLEMAGSHQDVAEGGGGDDGDLPPGVMAVSQLERRRSSSTASDAAAVDVDVDAAGDGVQAAGDANTETHDEEAGNGDHNSHAAEERPATVPMLKPRDHAQSSEAMQQGLAHTSSVGSANAAFGLPGLSSSTTDPRAFVSSLTRGSTAGGSFVDNQASGGRNLPSRGSLRDLERTNGRSTMRSGTRGTNWSGWSSKKVTRRAVKSAKHHTDPEYPMESSGGRFAFARRWEYKETLLTRKGEEPGPGHYIPELPKATANEAPKWSMYGRLGGDKVVASLSELGAGTCGIDYTAFGKQVDASKPTSTATRFGGRDSSHADVLSMVNVLAHHNLHDKQTKKRKGIRKLKNQQVTVKGLPGPGTYDVKPFTYQVLDKFNTSKARLAKARRVRAKRLY